MNAILPKLKAFLSNQDRLVIFATLAGYFGLPIAIFLLFWLRPVWALLGLGLLLAGLWLALRSFAYQPAYLTRRFVIVALLLALAWVALSGIGGLGGQNFDFHARNAVFHDLIERSWPVTYDYTGDPQMSALVGQRGLLVYYFLFWLPAAVVGKFFGWGWANMALFVWSVGGVFLTFLLLARQLRGGLLILPAAFVLFSGLDVLGELYMLAQRSGLTPAGVAATLFGPGHLESWPTILLQYSSFTTQLFYVFNQAIPAWLATLLLLASGRQNLLFVWVLLLPFAPLPALGLLPILAFQAFTAPGPLRAVFSGQNFCAGLLALGFAAFFSLSTGNHAHGLLWQLYVLPLGWPWLLSLFYALEFLVLAAILFLARMQRPLLLCVVLTLSLIPLYAYGRSNDLAMRASIPALLVLFVLAFALYQRSLQPGLPRAKLTRLLLSGLFVLGTLTALHEVQRSVADMLETGVGNVVKDKWKTFASVEEEEVIPYLENFVVGDPQDSVFVRYLMRQR